MLRPQSHKARRYIGAFEVPKDGGHLATLTAGYRRQRINFRLQRQAGYQQTLSKAILMVSKSLLEVLFFWKDQMYVGYLQVMGRYLSSMKGDLTRLTVIRGKYRG